MLNYNEEYANTAKLNDLYWTACEEYTHYLHCGLKSFKNKAELYFARYKERGGKRTKLITHYN